MVSLNPDTETADDSQSIARLNNFQFSSACQVPVDARIAFTMHPPSGGFHFFLPVSKRQIVDCGVEKQLNRKSSFNAEI